MADTPEPDWINTPMDQLQGQYDKWNKSQRPPQKVITIKVVPDGTAKTDEE